VSGDGGEKVGHDDGTGEVPGAQRGDSLEHVTVSEMKVHVKRGVEEHGDSLVG